MILQEYKSTSLNSPGTAPIVVIWARARNVGPPVTIVNGPNLCTSQPDNMTLGQALIPMVSQRCDNVNSSQRCVTGQNDLVPTTDSNVGPPEVWLNNCQTRPLPFIGNIYLYFNMEMFCRLQYTTRSQYTNTLSQNTRCHLIPHPQFVRATRSYRQCERSVGLPAAIAV